MNLKLNNEVRNTEDVRKKRSSLSVKEERQRTGRYIAILVGILLFLLAIYHAWVRKIPFIASLIVPAIIMFIYVGWVLYTASRDKHRALDAEAALNAAMAAEEAENAANTFDISIIANIKNTPDDIQKELAEISSAIVKGSPKNEEITVKHVKPIILVNDEPPDDLEEVVVQAMAVDTSAISRFKGLPTRRKWKRKFCRSKRNAAFKRSYSIA